MEKNKNDSKAQKLERKAERKKYKEALRKERRYGTNVEIGWDRLDNTAHLFPVIAGESMTNVYRIFVNLNEEIDKNILQQALDIVLPKFDGFNVRLRQGVFWYYFEENGKPAPKVKEESAYPCRYIVQNRNHSYLFRVSYYKNRINLEVFHVLTDGMGGLNFLKELTYQYLRIAHPKLGKEAGDLLSPDTSMNREDSFLKNYKKSHAKGYKTQKAFLFKGEKLRQGEFGVIHGTMSVAALKQTARKYGASINEYLVAAFVWSTYTEYLHGMPGKKPIRVAVPVNLRPFFNSVTTKNFFVMVSAEFLPEKESYTFEEVLQIIRDNLREQINREHLEELFSYNVSNEKLLIARAVPLFLKNIAIRLVYTQSALANTTTVTNIGNISVESEYQPYIQMFGAFLAMSKGQPLKGTICSYGDRLMFSFSSILADASVQRGFFCRLTEDGLEVTIESNGVYYE
ncbi:MAG: hypothetical protein J6A75_01495 [Lachnospiraceae bacterium]|nr:hypothetical protein [Lachnospiraceae bacterium]